MNIERIGKRSVIFTYQLAEWNLNLHLIIGEKYNYLIDTGLGSKSVEPVIEYLSGDPKPLIVVNTHYHFDHVWANHCFKDKIIISHSLCRSILIEKWDEMLSSNKGYIRGGVKLCPPNITIDDGLCFPDDQIKIFYTPGHTIDSISVYDEADKIISVGDNIGDNAEEIVPTLQTSKEVYLNTLQKYKLLDIESCISGHNCVQDKKVFDAIETMLLTQ